MDSAALPFSCITGVSKDVLRHIQEAALSGKAKYFLTMVALASFGNAGWQRQQGSPCPGHWCRFELSTWAREHQWSRQSTWRMRKQMEALHILRYVPDPADPQRGTLHWNLDFAEWVALDDTYRRQRYTRRGAGRPRKQDQASGEGNAHSTEGPSQPEKSNRRHLPPHLPHVPPETKSNGLHPSGHEGSSLPQKKSNGLHELAGTQIKVMTPTTVGVPPEAVQPPALRKGLRKKESETPLGVSETPYVSEPSRGGVIEDNRESYSSTLAPSPPPPLGAFPDTPEEYHTFTLVTSASELATCQAAGEALAEELAALRAAYENRMATFTAMKPRGITEIQAHIALRVEILRLQRGMEACEIALSRQQHRLKALEAGDVPADNGEVDQEVGESTSAPVPTDAVSLQGNLEQLERWREEVRDQQREVRRIQAEYDAITEQLKFATPLSMRNWGEAQSQQRFLARHLEDQRAKLECYEQFIALIEEGATPEAALTLVNASGAPSLQNADTEADTQEEMSPAEEPVASAPRLQGQPLRRALFAALTRLFTNGDPRFVTLERGRFNKAIQKFELVEIQPDDLPILKVVFERLWPRATCTALGLANNLPLLIGTARGMGWKIGGELTESGTVRAGTVGYKIV
jgi:hypothetical protein